MPTNGGSASHDVQTARAQSLYKQGAAAYDRRTGLARRYRERAVTKLALAPGETVIDVACGTGLNFPELLRGIGPEGHLLGVDLSPDMLGLARERAEKFGWGNVTLIESSIEEANLPTDPDAALFSLTHDVLQSRQAVENVVGALVSGGRVASFGAKDGPTWAAPLNSAARRLDRRFVTNFDRFDRPWTVLGSLIDLEVEPVLLGWGYIASGRKP
jgi:ubiquinone/menaquinone biosynthesis C-methylase UbiE